MGIHEFKIYKQRTSLLDMLSGIAGLLLTVILWNSRVKTIALSIYSLGMMRYFLSRFNAKKSLFLYKKYQKQIHLFIIHIYSLSVESKRQLVCCFKPYHLRACYAALLLFI